jgi:hypothetical protein
MTPAANHSAQPGVRSLWLFALTVLPYGAAVNFIQTTAPYQAPEVATTPLERHASAAPGLDLAAES